MALNETGLTVGDVRDGYRVSKVVDALAGRYVWQPVGSNEANVVDVTPTVVPADLAALEVAVPAAGQGAGVRWQSLYGVAPDYQIAGIVGGAWVDTDVDPGEVTSYATVATLPAPGTVTSGTLAVVVDDGVQSGTYFAQGPLASPATTWIKA